MKKSWCFVRNDNVAALHVAVGDCVSTNAEKLDLPRWFQLVTPKMFEVVCFCKKREKRFACASLPTRNHEGSFESFLVSEFACVKQQGFGGYEERRLLDQDRLQSQGLRRDMTETYGKRTSCTGFQDA